MISSPIPTSLETLAPMAAAMENPLAVSSNVKHFLRHKLCMSFAAHSKRSGKVRLPFAFPLQVVSVHQRVKATSSLYSDCDVDVQEFFTFHILNRYQEILTDPSYAGQFVLMTNPHIGNTGVNPGE
ncbi:hypothetical protein GW17_00019556 [Ensete ventricosum]|nr:hypothetical protein GW17_00019556 [Ensete ventricosum]